MYCTDLVRTLYTYIYEYILHIYASIYINVIKININVNSHIYTNILSLNIRAYMYECMYMHTRGSMCIYADARIIQTEAIDSTEHVV